MRFKSQNRFYIIKVDSKNKNEKNAKNGQTKIGNYMQCV